MDAAIYIRVSSDGQEDNTSLETQIAYCQRYADTTGLHVSGIYRDVASGGSMERRDLHRLRVLVREGLIDAIIVLSMDRLTREGGDWKELEKEFRRAGIALHSATQGEINLNDPTARLMTGFMIGYAEYEREIIKARMVRGKDSKADSGMPVGLGRSSYGYTVEVTRAGARKHHAWCLHDVHAPIVLRIFSEYVAGATVDNIARALTLEGIPTPGDDGRKPGNRKRGYGEWSAFNVYHILACETYTGRFYQHRFKAIEEKWKNGTGKNKLVLRPREEWKVTPVPAIIDDDLWHQAQARLAQGKAKAKRNARRFYLLGGQRFTCGICGYTMCGSLSHGEGFYRCGGTKRAGGTRAVQSCEGHRVASDTVEHAVWTWIKSILVPERLLL